MDTPSSHCRSRFLALALFVLLAAFLAPAAGAQQPVDLATITPVELSSTFEDWIILDARPLKKWAAGSIPGARSFSWQQLTRTDERGVEYRMLPPVEMAAKLGALGISQATPLVVYGDIETSWGGEGWACWLLAYLGHQGPIRLLEGGYEGWMDLGNKSETGKAAPLPTPVEYAFSVRQQLLWSPHDSEMPDRPETLVDTRPFFERLGSTLPDAVAISWKAFYTGNPPRPLSPGKYLELLKENEVDPASMLVFYCNGGVRSGYAWTVDWLSGRPGKARNYEGGTQEWSKR